MSDNGNYLQKIAIAGGTGDIGSRIIEQLLRSERPRFTITLISRTESSSADKYSNKPSIQIVKGDYSEAFLVKTLEGQDAFVQAVAFTVPLEAQRALYRAACLAKVPFIIPNEFGIDTENATVRKMLPSMQEKADSRAQIEEFRNATSWIGVGTNSWYDWSLKVGLYKIDPVEKKAVIFDGGDTKVGLTTLDTAAMATANLLKLPRRAPSGEPSLDLYKNKLVYVNSFYASQNEILQAIQKVVGSDGWLISHSNAKEAHEEAFQAFQNGNFNKYLDMIGATFFTEGAGNDGSEPPINDILGLPQGDIDAVTKDVLEEILFK